MTQTRQTIRRCPNRTRPLIDSDMVRGLYRTHDRLLGEAVRVHWSAGDAAPFVSLEVYKALGGSPEAAQLPCRDDYQRQTFLFVPDPLEETGAGA